MILTTVATTGCQGWYQSMCHRQRHAGPVRQPGVELQESCKYMDMATLALIHHDGAGFNNSTSVDISNLHHPPQCYENNREVRGKCNQINDPF